MNFPTKIGTDSNGYIINNLSTTNVLPEYQKIINFIKSNLYKTFNNNVHSIYLYGSVGKGSAVPGKSDVDLTIIYKEKTNTKINERLKQIEKLTLSKYKFVTKVDFDIGNVDDVLLKENQYSWGFWIKHCCLFIDGEDLSSKFPNMKPSNKIAFGVNGDVEEKIDYCLKQVAMLNNKNKIQSLIVSAIKKVIRSCYTLTIEEDMSWADDIKKSVDIFVHYYPDQNGILKLYDWILKPDSNYEKNIELLKYFKEWLKIKYSCLLN